MCDDLRRLPGRLIAAAHQHTDGIPILLSLITGLAGHPRMRLSAEDIAGRKHASAGPFAALMRLLANCYDGNVASHGQLIARGAWNLQRVNQCHWWDVF